MAAAVFSFPFVGRALGTNDQNQRRLHRCWRESGPRLRQHLEVEDVAQNPKLVIKDGGRHRDSRDLQAPPDELAFNVEASIVNA